VFTGKTTDVPGFDPPERGARPRGRSIIAVSADGKRAVTEKDIGSYLVFEIATGKELGSVAGDIFAGGVALSADGKVVAVDVGGKDMVREVIVQDVDEGRSWREWRPSKVASRCRSCSPRTARSSWFTAPSRCAPTSSSGASRPGS
jgi:hypothetical protein